jgi:hypothetical protein
VHWKQTYSPQGATMKNVNRTAAIVVVMMMGSVPTMAQSGSGSGSDSAPPPADAADQFKSAGQHISEGAQGIGQGIKQGAIQAWEAVKAGASAAGAKLNGEPAHPAPRPATGDDSH